MIRKRRLTAPLWIVICSNDTVLIYSLFYDFMTILFGYYRPARELLNSAFNGIFHNSVTKTDREEMLTAVI